MSSTRPAEPDPTARVRARFLRWRTPGPWIGFAAVFLVVLGVIGAAWIGVRALQARDALDEARSLALELRSSPTDAAGGADVLADRIVERTGRARELTSDPIWRIGELVPVLGVNLTAVRELALSTDEVAVGAIVPLAPVLDSLDPAALSPSGGGIDLGPLEQASGPVASASAVVDRARDRVVALRDAPVLGPVADARSELEALLIDTSGALDTARTVTALLPSLLGSDGPRDFVLVFQNNAEARALGGNPASLMQIETDGGRLRIVRQASSQDFPIRQPPFEVDLPAGSVDYGPFESYLMDATMRPDFPTAGALVKAYWERQYGGTVDGVMSFDPVALGYLLAATGPLELPDGTTLTSADAAGTLVHDVYYRYSDFREQNAFFEGAAATILQALTGGPVDVTAAGQALGRTADERRWLLWSTDPDEQAIIATTPLSGILPADETAPSVGVFFADQSSSKMDFYLATAVSSGVSCSADAVRYDTVVDLRSSITPDEAASLPFYVGTRAWGGEKFLTDVYVFGPAGSVFVETDRPDLIVSSGSDLGRPVVRFQVFLTPQEAATLRVAFTGADPEVPRGPLSIVTTPMYTPTDVSVTDPIC